MYRYGQSAVRFQLDEARAQSVLLSEAWTPKNVAFAESKLQDKKIYKIINYIIT